MIRSKWALTGLILFITLNTVLFQNCSKVAITPMEKPVITPVAELSLKAQACVNARSLLPEKTKFVFIIDLSQSNLGKYYVGDYNFNGRTIKNKYKFFNKALGTDPEGTRFNALMDFINTCGSGSDTEYSVIGFSDIAGSLLKNGAVNTLNCQPEFYGAAQALNRLNDLKTLQTQELAQHTQFVEPTVPYSSSKITQELLFKETNYVAASDCLSKTIEADIVKPTAAINYQVFFISDGEAFAKSTGCEDATVTDKVACYTSKMEDSLNYTMKLSSALLKQIRIHALYYTLTGASNSSIENYMKYLSLLGQTRDPINLGNIANTTSDNPFCKLLSIDRSIIFKTTSIIAVNKNAIKVQNRILRDSDGDGITDDDEINIFHSDPNNSRSMVPGVLDGICKMIGSKQLCQQERDKITCNPNQINNFNMSDCDIKILKLDKITSNPNLLGVDSDDDGIPDYIEILKGTNPLTADASIDSDSDGYTNLEEIANGTDPFTPDEPTSGSTKYSSSYKSEMDQCNNGGWTYSLDSLKSLEGSNEIIFFFKTISINSTTEYEYRFKTIQLNFELNPATNTLTPLNTSSSVFPNDFEVITPGAQ